MNTVINPPWWSAEDNDRAANGARLTDTADFYGKHMQQLETLASDICRAVRSHLHGATPVERDQGRADALQLLNQYKAYCYDHGAQGQRYYDGKLATAARGKDAPETSFAYALHLLKKYINEDESRQG